MKLPSDFGVEIGKALGLQIKEVEDLFTFEEDKQGFFIAKLKPKKFLEKPQFKALCEFVRTLNGEAYLEGAKAWSVPGPFAKKPSQAVGTKMPTSVPTSVPASLPTKKSGFEILPLAALVSMPFRSRADLPDPDLEDLAESIKEVGVLEPILVREKGGFYEIVMGERRVEASRKARRGDIPAIVKVLSDEQAYDMQLVENIQRKDLSDMETARALKWRIDTFKYTQEVLAKKLGKSQPWVANHLRMLQLPDSIISREITEAQSREILAANPEKQKEIIDQINKTGEVPSSREIHEAARPSVPCDQCGEPAYVPIHTKDNKNYCSEDCLEQAKAEAQPSLLPPEGKGKEELSQPSHAKLESKDLYTGVEWECPECHDKLVIHHIDHENGSHSHEFVNLRKE